ncbi:MAG: hypothetical protein K5890_00330 [Bacteroidales bacterium]|nr:hypothetical protein [Bacteroidales bacterium]
MLKKLSFTGGNRKRGVLHTFCATLLLAFFMLGGMSVWAQESWHSGSQASFGGAIGGYDTKITRVEAWGGGGGGGYGSTGGWGGSVSTSGGSGGGGGGFAGVNTASHLPVNASVSISYGGGGAGTKSKGGSGSAGGQTKVSYNNSVFLTANGGSPGSGRTGGAGGQGGSSTLSGVTTHNGGKGGNGNDVNVTTRSGGGGGAAGANRDGHAGNNGSYPNNGGRSSTEGVDNPGSGAGYGAGAASGATGIESAGSYGGGGGGNCGLTNTSSGSGAGGGVRIYYYRWNPGAIASGNVSIEAGQSASSISNSTSANYVSGVATVSYRWKCNGTVISGATGASYTPGTEYTSTPGTYTFTREAKDASYFDWKASSGSYKLTVTAPATVEFTTTANEYEACPGTEVFIQTTLSSAHTYKVFTDAEGNTLSSSIDDKFFHKTNSATEYAYVQAYSGTTPVGDRVVVTIKPNSYCGSTTDITCTDGTILFKEDFGGNSASDPVFSSVENPNASSSVPFTPDAPAGYGHYSLEKTDDLHLESIYPDNVNMGWCVNNASDHTHSGDPTLGYMMFIDPSYELLWKPMYTSTIDNLCSGSNLTFSFWISDLQSGRYDDAHPDAPAAPALFDVQLQDPNTGEVLVQTGIWQPDRIDYPGVQIWQQYGLDFVVPAGLSSVKFVLRNCNYSTTSYGNDYAIDDVQAKFCGGKITMTATDQSTCTNVEAQLCNTVNLSGTDVFANPAYKWQYSSDGSVWSDMPSSNNTCIETSNSGFYRMFVANSDVIAGVPGNGACALKTETDIELTAYNVDAVDDYFNHIKGSTAVLELDVLANDNNACGNAPVVTVNPTKGTVVLDGSVFKYTPTSGSTGDDQFTYKLVCGSCEKTAVVYITELDLNIGCPTADGNCYTFNSLTVSGNVRTITVGFTEDPETGMKVNLPDPLPTDWVADGNDYTQFITLPEGATAAEVQAFLRQVSFCVPNNTLKGIRILVDGEVTDGRIYYNSENRHYYEYVMFDLVDDWQKGLITKDEMKANSMDKDLTWVDCYNRAKNTMFRGRSGYLPTITSLSEDIFVTRMTEGVAWVGGTRMKSTGDAGAMYYAGFNTSDETSPAVTDSWYWACGPEKGNLLFDTIKAVIPSGMTAADFYNSKKDASGNVIYSNWAGSEPNNSGSSESCLTILKTGETYEGYQHHTPHFSWNDKSNLSNFAKDGNETWSSRGYLIEFGDQEIGDSHEDHESDYMTNAVEKFEKVGNGQDTVKSIITGSKTFCSGAESYSTELKVEFQGEAPFSGKISGTDGSEYAFTNINALSYTQTVNLTATTTYTVTTLSDDAATSCHPTVISKMDGAAVVTIADPFTAPTDITYNEGIICNGDNVTFTATGGTGVDGEIFWSETGCPEAAFFEDFKTISSDYTPKNSTFYVNDNGNLVVTATGSDPWINMYGLGSFNPNTYQYYQMRYKVLSGDGGTAEFFFANTHHNTATTYYSTTAPLISDNEWHIATFNTANAAESGSWTSGGNITGWRFDYSNSSDVTMEIDYITLTNAPAVGATYTVTAPTAGNHTIYADRLSGCHTGSCKSQDYNVPEALTITQSGDITPAKCKGGASGAFSFTVSGGTTPYTVSVKRGSTDVPATQISNSGNTYTVTELTAGDYAVSVVDAHNCTANSATSYTVNEPVADLAVANITSTPESCDGNDATATIEVTGGTAPYTVRLVDGSNTLTPTMVEGKYKFTDLTSGAPTTTSKTYTVNVTDANSCTPTSSSPGSVTITLDNPLDMDNITIPPVCSGYEFSYVPANGTDGTIPTGTTYSWPQPAAISGISGLAASTGDESRIHGTLTNSTNAPIVVTYTVTPKLGVCVGNATPSSVTINAAATINPLVTVDVADREVCPNAGTIKLIAPFSNVNSVHNVVWKQGTTSVKTTNNIPATITADTLSFSVPTTPCKETYNFTVEYTDASHCTASDAFAVKVRIPAWSISSTDFPAGADNVECQADATEPTAVPTGAQILDGCGQATTRELYSTVVSPNPIVDQGTVTYTYRYTACDGSHNDWQFVYTVDDQTDPTFNADVITTKPATVPETPNCTFFVPDLTPDVIGSVTDNCSSTDNNDFTVSQNPAAGTQITETTTVTVTVTDKAGNSSSTDVQVTVPTPVTANVTGESAITNVTCHGGNNGSFTVTANDGKTPYQYSRDGGAYQTSNTFSDLTAGTYSVMVKDANNCTIATPITVTVTEPDALHIDGFPTDNVSEFCDPDKGYATVTWTAPTFGPSDNSATMTILVEYPDGTTANALPTDNHYPVGTTTITYTATNSCPEEVVKSFTITVIDNQPPCIGCVPGNLDPEATDGNSCAKIIASETNNITLSAGTFTYQHSGNNWDVTAADNDGIKSLRYELTGATSGNGTSLDNVTFNVGKTTVTWTAVDNSDLTDQCSFDVIVKAQVTVTANTNSFDYDGTAHTDNGYVLTSGTVVSNGTSGTPVDLPNHDKLTAVITGTITNAGSVPNVVDNVTVMRGSEDMTEYYVINKVNGTLTVDKTDLVLIDSVFSKIYDGTPLVLNFNVLDKVIGLASGDALTAGEVATDGYIAGHYTYNYPVLDGASYVPGTMTNGTAYIVVPFQTTNGIENYNLIIHIYVSIVPRDITITGGSDTKIYDGTALTNSTYSQSGLAATDEITTVTVTGSQVCVGQSANEPSNAEIKHRSDNVVVNNSYNISYEDGTLEVTDIPSDNLTCPPQYDIVLWYGRCDTVAYMPAFPTLSPNVAYPDVKFVSNVDEFNPLQPGQTYNITWSVLDACGEVMATTHCTQVVTVSYPPCDTVEDRDGFRYGAKRIGCDCWTVDNLRSTLYSDDTPVNSYWRYKDSDSLENIYGKLYTWYSAARVTEDDDMAIPAEIITTTGAYVQGVCPEGWALPKMAEFWTMYTASGGQAGLVKSPSSLVWLPERAGIAENKFNAFGAGYYAPTIERYENLLGETHFWASDTSRTAMMAKNFELNYYCENGLENLEDKGLGYSIRCVKKEPVFECGETGVSDLQGNGYGTLKVGNQCWMTENVRYRTADYKPVTDQNGNEMDPRIFGYLYTWNTIFNGETPGDEVQGICPKGWHIPTAAEWNELQTNLANESANVCDNTVGKAMASTFGWINSTTTCAVGNEPANNNNSLFNAMPVGGDDATCNGFGNITNFWTATESSADKANVRDLNYNSPDMSNYAADKTSYIPLRCVKNL